MSIVGPSVPIETYANGVLSAVYDPVLKALRVSGGGGGPTGAIIIDPSTNTRNTIQATNDSTELTLKAFASQTEHIFKVYDTSGNLAVDIDATGILDARQIAVQDPPDTGGDGNVTLSPGHVAIARQTIGSAVPLQVFDTSNVYFSIQQVGHGSVMEVNMIDPTDVGWLFVSAIAQSANIIEAWDISFTTRLFTLLPTGGITSNAHALPADGVLDNSSFSLWLDDSVGAPVLNVKMKDSAGTAFNTALGAGGGSSPLTTKGDLYTFSTVNARLAVGTNGQFLQANSAATTGNQWSTLSGDASIATGGALALTAIGSATGPIGDGTHVSTVTIDTKGRVTALTSTAITGLSPLTTKGDLFGFSTLPARLPVGSDTWTLIADSSQTLGVKWGPVSSISAPFIDTTNLTSDTSLYDSFVSNISVTASASLVVDQMFGYIYQEPQLIGSGTGPYTRTVQVAYTSGNTFLTKTDGTAFIAGDVTASVPAGNGIQAGTTISGLSSTNHHADLNHAVTESHAAVTKVFSRSTTATGYTGTTFFPTLTTQWGIYVPPLTQATNNWAAYLAGMTVDGAGNVAGIGNLTATGTTTLGSSGPVTISSTGVIISSAASGNVLGNSTSQSNSVLEIDGATTSIPIHILNAFLGLSYVATEFNGGNPSLDLRSTRGSSLSSLAATHSGDVLGAFHIGGSGSSVLIDCAQIQCVATELFTNSNSGTRWDMYTTLNGGNVKGLALRLGNDKKITVYGSVNANSGDLTTDAGFTLTGAITGATNLLYTDGTISLTTATLGVASVLRWDAPTSNQTGSPSVVLDGARVSAGTWAALTAGDVLGSLSMRGQYDTTVAHQNTGVLITAVAEGTFSSTAGASRFELRTTTAANVNTRRMIIDSTGTMHYGSLTLTSNLVTAAAIGLKASDGSFFAGGGLTYGSNQPTAAPFFVNGTPGSGVIASVTQATVGNPVISYISTATNDDPTETVYQFRVATTDATVTTLGSIALPASTSVAVDCVVVARRTGGSAGTADDAAAYVLRGIFKAQTTLTVTQAIIGESVAGYDAVLDSSSNNMRIRVTGVVNTNITWHATLKWYPVGT